ncbi:MAG TPA: hypothetical protein VHD14_00545 [Pseudolabrys sp.]|nr:hypothetical protein [Pseudolabrys sp.]
MATKRTGKPRGRPRGSRKRFRSDPDRFIIGMARALLDLGAVDDFENAADAAIAFHRGKIGDLIENPLSNTRRLKLCQKTVARLKAGYSLQKWGEERLLNRDIFASVVERLRKKAARWEHDRDAVQWLAEVRAGWKLLLSTDGNNDPLFAFLRYHRALSHFGRVGEMQYFTSFVPRLRSRLAPFSTTK